MRTRRMSMTNHTYLVVTSKITIIQNKAPFRFYDIKSIAITISMIYQSVLGRRQNEHLEFDDNGSMRIRDMSANHYPIQESERR